MCKQMGHFQSTCRSIINTVQTEEEPFLGTVREGGTNKPLVPLLSTTLKIFPVYPEISVKNDEIQILN